MIKLNCVEEEIHLHVYLRNNDEIYNLVGSNIWYKVWLPVRDVFGAKIKRIMTEEIFRA